MDDAFWKQVGEAIDAQVKELAERQAINTAKYLNESYAAVRKEMNNENERQALIKRMKTAAGCYFGETSPLFREAVAEIERIEKLMEQNNSKHMEVLGKLKETNDKYNKLIEENNRLDGKNLWLESEVKRLKEQVEELEKSFPGYETTHIKPEELFGNSGLRDQFAIAALDRLVSNGIYNPESNARWAYQQADEMLKARVK